jgi:ADP-heptose:LPS heptosyltransferase
LLSYATVVVGNDSGPKHLASLRGTNVVSIFGARTNWLEWGQENVGSVISRKLPCAGCMVHHDPEECGRDFICLSDIKPQEVFEAMKVYICQAKVKKA